MCAMQLANMKRCEQQQIYIMKHILQKYVFEEKSDQVCQIYSLLQITFHLHYKCEKHTIYISFRFLTLQIRKNRFSHTASSISMQVCGPASQVAN